MTAPKHLSADRRKLWQSIVASHELEPHHLELLRLACEALDRAEDRLGVPPFECLGRGRGSRWRLAGNRNDASGEPMGTDPSRCEGETLADRLAEVERRLAEVERMVGVAP